MFHNSSGEYGLKDKALFTETTNLPLEEATASSAILNTQGCYLATPIVLMSLDKQEELEPGPGQNNKKKKFKVQDILAMLP